MSNNDPSDPSDAPEPQATPPFPFQFTPATPEQVAKMIAARQRASSEADRIRTETDEILHAFRIALSSDADRLTGGIREREVLSAYVDMDKIFGKISKAVSGHPPLVRKHLALAIGKFAAMIATERRFCPCGEDHAEENHTVGGGDEASLAAAAGGLSAFAAPIDETGSDEICDDEVEPEQRAEHTAEIASEEAAADAAVDAPDDGDDPNP